MKGFGNINNIMQKAQEMQEELEKKQEELAEKEVEATAGGGMIKVVMNGNEEVVDISIEKEVIDPEDPQGQVSLARVGPESMPRQLEPGDRIELHYVLGVVTTITKP